MNAHLLPKLAHKIEYYFELFLGGEGTSFLPDHVWKKAWWPIEHTCKKADKILIVGQYKTTQLCKHN